MSAIVDKWVEMCKGLPNVGAMTHKERLTRALTGQPTDFVPVAPEAELYSVLHRGRHNFHEVFRDVEAAIDSGIGAWYDLRFDLITQYLDIGHELEPMLAPQERHKYLILRNPEDYVVFKPVTTDLDEAISLFKNKVWEKYGFGRAGDHFIPIIQGLIEFQNRTGQVLVATGAASPSNHAETTVEVQNFIKWMVTEPKQKIHYYLELVTEERLGALDGYKAFAGDLGLKFFYLFGGARTWGPRQWDEFGKYDRMFGEKACSLFELPVWHYCGNNLLQGIDALADLPIKGVQYDMPMSQYKMPYPQWFEAVAKKLGPKKIAAMNAPTTQLALYGTPGQVKQMVRDFIKHTAPYTTPIIMPGCEIGSRTPEANVAAMIEAGRTYGKYPINLEGEDPELEDYPGRK